jgi:signal transduction histidine kinase
MPRPDPTLKNLSLRFKVPFNLSLAILFTAVVVAVTLVWHEYGDLRERLHRESAELARALSGPLAAALKHDDPWQAYRVMRSLGSDTPGARRSLVLLDGDGRVFVSSHPRKYRMHTRLADIDGATQALVEEIERSRGNVASHDFETSHAKDFYVVAPVVDDGVIRGTLVFIHPESIFQPALTSIVRRVTVSMLLVMSLLLPVAWYIGNRTVAPLLDLAQRMSAVGKAPVEQIERARVSRKDEIGQLAGRFNQMLGELQEKEHLERQVIVSERLAALGRLVAGVAHEVNNPLGGMLNAINTFRRYGHPDERTEKTISLLERGLEQIRDTVSALLVEAKAEWHGLTAQDVEDVRTLVQPDATRRRLAMRWVNDLDGALAMPATPVRQMLINLSLNAVQATRVGGRVTFSIGAREGRLDIKIENESAKIPEAEMARLFEPFASGRAGGTGLGLWVTYQIVRQLDGEIMVVSDEESTRFEIRLPMKEAA